MTRDTSESLEEELFGDDGDEPQVETEETTRDQDPAVVGVVDEDADDAGEYHRRGEPEVEEELLPQGAPLTIRTKVQYEPQVDDKVYLTTLPKLISITSEQFEKDKYKSRNEQIKAIEDTLAQLASKRKRLAAAAKTPQERQTLKQPTVEEKLLKERLEVIQSVLVQNMIRWREVVDENGQKKRESNARLVRWSNGTFSLQIGDKYFEVKSENLKSSTNLLLVNRSVHHPSTLLDAANGDSKESADGTKKSKTADELLDEEALEAYRAKRMNAFTAVGAIGKRLQFLVRDIRSETHKILQSQVKVSRSQLTDKVQLQYDTHTLIKSTEESVIKAEEKELAEQYAKQEKSLAKRQKSSGLSVGSVSTAPSAYSRNMMGKRYTKNAYADDDDDLDDEEDDDEEDDEESIRRFRDDKLRKSGLGPRVPLATNANKRRNQLDEADDLESALAPKDDEEGTTSTTAAADNDDEEEQVISKRKNNAKKRRIGDDDDDDE